MIWPARTFKKVVSEASSERGNQLTHRGGLVERVREGVGRLVVASGATWRRDNNMGAASGSPFFFVYFRSFGVFFVPFVVRGERERGEQRLHKTVPLCLVASVVACTTKTSGDSGFPRPSTKGGIPFVMSAGLESYDTSSTLFDGLADVHGGPLNQRLYVTHVTPTGLDRAMAVNKALAKGYANEPTVQHRGTMLYP